METFTLSFQVPSPPVSINAVRGRHWGASHQALAPWRDSAWVHARNAKVRREVPGWWGASPVTIQVDLPFAQAARRDPHNYVGTNVKAVVDGLVHAGLVPDDTPDWVTVLEPTLSVSPPPRRATVTITRRTP